MVWGAACAAVAGRCASRLASVHRNTISRPDRDILPMTVGQRFLQGSFVRATRTKGVDMKSVRLDLAKAMRDRLEPVEGTSTPWLERRSVNILGVALGCVFL